MLYQSTNIHQVKNIDSLIRKYYEGKCNREELAELYKLLASEPELRFEKAFQEIWTELQVVPSLNEQQSEKINQNIRNAIQHQFKTTPWYSRSWLKIAAAISLLALVTGLWISIDGMRWEEISTAYGEVREIELPDGTHINLYANSSLKYATDFNGKPVREIWLEGEAFFEVHTRFNVENNSKVPFLVHTNRLVIQVVGTRFNVRERRGQTEVVLDEGKVNLIGRVNLKDTVALTPGQKAFIDDSEIMNISEIESTTPYSSWTWNELYFEDKTLKDIVAQAEDHFGINIVLKPVLEDLRFTGSSPADDPEVLLLSLQKSFNLNIEKRGASFYLEP